MIINDHYMRAILDIQPINHSACRIFWQLKRQPLASHDEAKRQRNYGNILMETLK